MNDIRVRRPRKLQKSVLNGVLWEAGRLNPVGAMGITLNMQPLSRVSMTIPEWDPDLAMHDLVEVYNHKGSVGIYRVTKITNAYRKERKIELSHGLDTFSDSAFSTAEEYRGTVTGMLQKIMAAQTQTIGGVPYWQLGTCEDGNVWNKDISNDNLMTCLTDIAKAEEDYVFTFDQSTFPWTLNFVRRDDTVLSEFRLNRNTESCSVALDDADMCTRLFLSVTTETADASGAGTYINEGYFTYNDSAAQQLWGIICKSAGVDRKDFASDAALQEWVNAYFSRHNTPNVQITVDGIELVKLTGETIDEAHLSRMCRVALPEYNSTFNERIVSVNYPDALRNPMAVKVAMANKRQTAEDAFQQISKTAKSAEQKAKSGGSGSHNDATYFRKTLADTANGLYSRIEMTASYIRTEVANTACGLYSRIEQTASQISMKVSRGDVATELAVECGNVTISGGNLVVDGMVTAAAVQSAIAQIAAVSVIGLNATGTIKANAVQAASFNLTGGGDLSNAIQTLFDGYESSGKIKIDYQRINGGTGSINFNIAATQTYRTAVAAAESTGYVNGEPKDADVGSQIQGTRWYVNITRKDDTTRLLEIDMSSVYTKAREGYTLGTFRLATAQANTTLYYSSGATAGTGYWYRRTAADLYYKS